ncbi:MAG: hypothetical protein ACRDV9_05335 [Acidimicrobiia bacterium]
MKKCISAVAAAGAVLWTLSGPAFALPADATLSSPVDATIPAVEALTDPVTGGLALTPLSEPALEEHRNEKSR